MEDDDYETTESSEKLPDETNFQNTPVQREADF
jgi:hypothetical protein